MIFAWLAISMINGQPVEEFLVRGPDQLHSIAINTFLEERRKNPEIKDMGDNSPVMIRAKQHAIRRFSILDDNELKLTVRFKFIMFFIWLLLETNWFRT